MKHRILLPAAILLLCWTTAAQAATPNLREVKLVAQLPKELPQEIIGLAYDGEQLWATIFHGRGAYAKLDPASLTWTVDKDPEHHRIIESVNGIGGPAGVCFADGMMWIGGAFGESFGPIDPQNWTTGRVIKRKQRTGTGTQIYSSLAWDGNNLWIAWHWIDYKQPLEQTQRLLKVDPLTGNVIADFPVPPGNPNDLTHALTFDGTNLWHMKDQRLSAIDPATGKVTAVYIVPEICRASGLAWIKDTLWISEFNGKIWRLPFTS